jgi:hypothetical protein
MRNIKETIISTPSPKFKTGPPVPPKPLQERKQFDKNVHEFDMYDRQYIPDPCMYHHDYHFPEVKVVDDDDEIIDTHPHEDELHHHHHHLIDSKFIDLVLTFSGCDACRFSIWGAWSCSLAVR